MSHAQDAVDLAHRREWHAVLAATVRVTRDLDLAQECVQEAYADALVRWPDQGVPDRPAAWLTMVARHRALDAVRRAMTLRSKLPLLVEPETADPDVIAHDHDDHEDGDEWASIVPDDRLRLIFLCCHPALAPSSQVALTLRLVCGVATATIAQAFLVSEPTMAARITRAKRKIATAGIAFRMPARADLPERMDACLAVIYLLFTVEYGPEQTGLGARAIELSRTVHELVPGHREAAGLLALITADRARRSTRADPAGRLVPLELQDRSAWDRDAIAEAERLTLSALRGGKPGRYAVQAAIAVLHATAPNWAETDWAQIVALYDALIDVWPSPVVAVNRAIAIGMTAGPAAGLAELDDLTGDPRLARYRYLAAARADALRRLGRSAEATVAYEQATELSVDEAERAFFADRIADLTGGATARGTGGPASGVDDPLLIADAAAEGGGLDHA